MSSPRDWRWKKARVNKPAATPSSNAASSSNVYGEGSSSVRRPTAVQEAVSMRSAGVDSLSLDSRPVERSSESPKSEIVSHSQDLARKQRKESSVNAEDKIGMIFAKRRLGGIFWNGTLSLWHRSLKVGFHCVTPTSDEFLPLIEMSTFVRIMGEVRVANYATYFNSAPYSIGERVIVFQVMPFSEEDLPAYRFVYDSLTEVNTFGIIQNHEFRYLPPPLNTFCVFPLGKNDSYPCDLQRFVKPVLRRARKANWLMAVAVVSNPLFDEIRAARAADSAVSVEEKVIEETLTRSSPTAFPVAVIHPQQRPNPASAADGQRRMVTLN